MVENLSSDPIFARLANFGPPKSFTWVYLEIVVRHCSKLSFLGNLKESKSTKLEKMAKIFISDPIFLVSFTSISSYKLFQSIILGNLKESQWTKLEKMAKNVISGSILVHLARLAQILAHQVFSKFYLC